MAFANPESNIKNFGLRAGMMVADFGVGVGAHTLLSARAVGDGHVYAIDVQKEVLAALARRAEEQKIRNISYLWGDVEQLGGSKLKDGSVDAVMIINLLFQISNKYTLAQEAARVVRPSGWALIIDWEDSFGGLGPPASDVIKSGPAAEIFKSAGFEPAGTFPAGDHHWGLRLRRAVARDYRHD